MFIVHSIGSDEENPFKVFTARGDAAAGAKDIANGSVERVFVYEWTGDLHSGLAEARKGLLQPIMHFPHYEAPRVPPPERPIRISERSKEILKELIKKMPRIAGRF